MTTDQTRDKVRGLLLAALMVFSVVGGTVALTGAAAAADNVTAGANQDSISGDAISTTNVTEGTTIENHMFRFTATNMSGDTATVYLEFENGYADGLSPNNASAEYTNGTNIPLDDPQLVDGNDSDGVRDTLKVELTPDAGEDVEFQFDTRTVAPSVSSNQTFNVTAEVNDSWISKQIGQIEVIDIDSATTGFLSGRVSDQNNNDIQDAKVIAERQSDGLTATTFTNNNGEYTLQLPVGDYNITVEREGFNTATSKDNNVAANQTTSANLVITRKIGADRITIVDSDKVAVADGSSEVSYTLLVEHNDTESGDYTGMSGVQVTHSAPGAVNFGSATATTNESGYVTFTATSTQTGEFDVAFTEQDGGNSVSTTATFRPEKGSAELYGEVSNYATEDIADATVWVAYPGENQTLAYAQENQDYLVDQTNENGEYAIHGIVDEGSSAHVNVYVMASGYNAVNETDSGVGAWVAANQTETVTANATENHDFLLQAGGPAQEYQLDVTVEGQKSVEAPIDSEVTATVHVEQRQKGSSLQWSDADNQNVTVSLTNAGPLDPNSVTVTTNANGEAQVTFTGEQTGDTNITAMTTSEEGVEYNTTGGEQAMVSVYGTGSITGDVVNEDDEALAAGQATVQLFVKNTQGEYVPAKTVSGQNRTSQIGSSGAYVFTDVRSGEQYRMVATTTEGLTGQATTGPSIPAGTTTNDIVVVGATPSPADFQVSELDPQDATVTQGESITVSAMINNTGLGDDVQTVELQIGGDVVATQDVSLDGGEATTVTFSNVSTDSLSAGTYTHGVYTNDDSQTGTLEVESSGSGSGGLSETAAAYDSNNNGDIEIGELGQAAAAFSNGDITVGELGTIAAAYSN